MFARLVSERLGGISARQDEVATRVARLEERLESVQQALGRIETRQLAAQPFRSLAEAEFRVFSQGGEDGLLQALLRLVPTPSKTFVEFGVQDYSEANTRFLLLSEGWSGLVIDCDPGFVRQLEQTRAYLNHPLQAACAFVTRENINTLLADHGLEGEVGLLSIDVDGNDYWIWEAIEGIRPVIVIVEYNHRFGPDVAVTVPYDPDFRREAAHPSMLYYGASLRALWALGSRMGYDLVACTRSGVNAVFVRADLRPAILPALNPEAAFRVGTTAECRDAAGKQQKVAIAAERELVLSFPLVQIEAPGAVGPC